MPGATVLGSYIQGDTKPLSGGFVTDITSPNLSTEITAQFTLDVDAALAAPVPEAGAREIGPFDCAGLVSRSSLLFLVLFFWYRSSSLYSLSSSLITLPQTAHNCCLKIKVEVKDSDIYGNAIQCFTFLKDGSNKLKYFFNHRGKKVHIFTNKLNQVNKVPKIVGNRPAQSDLEGWVAEGGTQDDEVWRPAN